MAETAATGLPGSVDEPTRQPVMATLSAEELAVRSRSGCKASFTELIRRYNRRLHGFLRQRTACAADAEDLVQDTFIKAYANLHRYDETWSFSTWLFTIARRVAVSHYRRMSVASSVEPGVEPSHSPEPSDVIAQRDARASLWRLAETLPEAHYRALWLRYAEGMPIEDIARILGKSRVNVKVLLHRARLKLSGHLQKYPSLADAIGSPIADLDRSQSRSQRSVRGRFTLTTEKPARVTRRPGDVVPSSTTHTSAEGV